ncbi:ABC transporter ATP-binding protein [Pelolinea submarina]|uniref:Energy-coupling factor transport system ATP-binding protein n=1 Tax=Pelolinea submarina TaxID=913107 RepID=A0A347ZTK5_9CHLR|nr:ABC transporter ATP-binding protein [Pelolinea submarina]REG10787.1 energy-coupling factor transport system ATP-binding protein [Pelolinea submarina]BBB48636.1 ABC transport system ATP-binding protein [Pelolinea submarina]
MKIPNLLTIENLNFRYLIREEPALKDINLCFSSGEVSLIAGASGCGKTTLIRCINGLIPHSYRGEKTGQITAFGKDLSTLKLAEISQMIGTVLQDPERQILGTKVVNEVAFGLENLSFSRSEILNRVDESLARLKISDLRNRDTFSLSGGEKQKVALAGVLAMRPGILLLDEPLASLDPASAEETLAILRILADEGMAILMVEHRVEDVLKIHPERVIFMSSGEVRYQGTAGELDETINYRDVKLPAPMIIDRVKKQKDVHTFPVFKLPEQNKQSLVSFRNVEYFYEEGVPILHGISLDIRHGDVIAVLGPNGAGKTTLVKHAIGLLKPKAGQVLIGERDTSKMSVAEIAQTLGYVFQSPSHMLFAPTVEEELSFGPQNLGHNKTSITKEVKEAIDIVNLSGMEQIPPLSLSFGQQKRVSIAAVLAMRSKILVMDEPSAGQDYRNYIDFMDAILQLPNFDAILFITHDIDLAVIYANRILMVNNGQLVADGKPQDILKDYDHLHKNRLVPTSLLDVNLKYLGKTGRFMRAEQIAQVL